ncbi:MAG: (2Fe-2S) ferredoxin domain-containing protein [Firmicutes bacterium]|nr:(2Fe-2S) ferredoxin domain-containing protein [Bacillota bacterium]MDD4263135.1 (2Fe-2S) ferredoxin domain-containing protein [Bacillota bacterium]MDD4694184.1 (2Fe-2S) ferredoxin domain-containing protein [Bacillota bacterium]
MISIQVCVGSSCHLKGAHDVVQAFKKQISAYKLDNEVFLTGAFCLGKCLDGVSIKIDDELVLGVQPDNVPEIFQNRVLDILGG